MRKSGLKDYELFLMFATPFLALMSGAELFCASLHLFRLDFVGAVAVFGVFFFSTVYFSIQFGRVMERLNRNGINAPLS